MAALCDEGTAYGPESQSCLYEAAFLHPGTPLSGRQDERTGVWPKKQRAETRSQENIQLGPHPRLPP